jgi:hypothetical protein
MEKRLKILDKDLILVKPVYFKFQLGRGVLLIGSKDILLGSLPE